MLSADYLCDDVSRSMHITDECPTQAIEDFFSDESWRCPPPSECAGRLHLDAFEAPVYRSLPCSSVLVDPDVIPMDAGHADDAWMNDELCGLPVPMGAQCDQEPTPALERLPSDVLDNVLCFLDPHPDLFALCAVNRACYRVTRAHYASRRITAPAGEDGLRDAVGRARSGDTIVCEPGTHSVASTITLEVPLRIVAATSAENVVITAESCVAPRCRNRVSCEGISIQRTCATGVYPNAAVHVESGELELSRCAITGAAEPCVAGRAGALESAATAARQAPLLGQPPRRPPSRLHPPPQTGVVVAPGASASLVGCRIEHHRGPAVKVTRGKLFARETAFGHSACGANIVVNGGSVALTASEVHSCVGDGISVWNNPGMRIDGNRIHSNSGSGISLHSRSREVRITSNRIYGNGSSGVDFAASHIEATLDNNTYDDHPFGMNSALPGAAIPKALSLNSTAFARVRRAALPRQGAGVEGAQSVVDLPNLVRSVALNGEDAFWAGL